MASFSLYVLLLALPAHCLDEKQAIVTDLFSNCLGISVSGGILLLGNRQNAVLLDILSRSSNRKRE